MSSKEPSRSIRIEAMMKRISKIDNEDMLDMLEQALAAQGSGGSNRDSRASSTVSGGASASPSSSPHDTPVEDPPVDAPVEDVPVEDPPVDAPVEDVPVEDPPVTGDSVVVQQFDSTLSGHSDNQSKLLRLIIDRLSTQPKAGYMQDETYSDEHTCTVRYCNLDKERVQMEDDGRGNISCIYGPPQLGKTSEMIFQAYKDYFCHGLLPVIITKSKGADEDKGKFIKEVNDLNARVQNHLRDLRKEGHVVQDCDIEKRFCFATKDTSFKSVMENKKLDDFIDGRLASGQASIVVECLNHIPIGKMAEFMNTHMDKDSQVFKNGRLRMSVTLDEAHQLFKTMDHRLITECEMFKTIIPQCFKTKLITATPAAILQSTTANDHHLQIERMQVPGNHVSWAVSWVLQHAEDYEPIWFKATQIMRELKQSKYTQRETVTGEEMWNDNSELWAELLSQQVAKLDFDDDDAEEELRTHVNEVIELMITKPTVYLDFWPHVAHHHAGWKFRSSSNNTGRWHIVGDDEPRVSTIKFEKCKERKFDVAAHSGGDPCDHGGEERTLPRTWPEYKKEVFNEEYEKNTEEFLRLFKESKDKCGFRIKYTERQNSEANIEAKQQLKKIEDEAKKRQKDDKKKAREKRQKRSCCSMVDVDLPNVEAMIRKEHEKMDHYLSTLPSGDSPDRDTRLLLNIKNNGGSTRNDVKKKWSDTLFTKCPDHFQLLHYRVEDKTVELVAPHNILGDNIDAFTDIANDIPGRCTLNNADSELDRVTVYCDSLSTAYTVLQEYRDFRRIIEGMFVLRSICIDGMCGEEGTSYKPENHEGNLTGTYLAFSSYACLTELDQLFGRVNTLEGPTLGTAWPCTVYIPDDSYISNRLNDSAHMQNEFMKLHERFHGRTFEELTDIEKNLWVPHLHEFIEEMKEKPTRGCKKTDDARTGGNTNRTTNSRDQARMDENMRGGKERSLASDKRKHAGKLLDNKNKRQRTNEESEHFPSSSPLSQPSDNGLVSHVLVLGPDGSGKVKCIPGEMFRLRANFEGKYQHENCLKQDIMEAFERGDGDKDTLLKEFLSEHVNMKDTDWKRLVVKSFGTLDGTETKEHKDFLKAMHAMLVSADSSEDRPSENTRSHHAKRQHRSQLMQKGIVDTWKGGPPFKWTEKFKYQLFIGYVKDTPEHPEFKKGDVWACVLEKQDEQATDVETDN